jgi:hypothetical protein
VEEKLSQRIALALLNAESAEEVKAILADEDASYYFSDSANWSNYGNREKNWDTVGNQQTNPVGALVELIINGEDAILLRKAAEAGIKNPRGADAPKSMTDAVKRFFPHVNEGKIQKLSPAERTELGDQCVRVGIRRADRKNSRFPTYVVLDAGCGQPHDKFAETFLSLGEKNKEGIQFVQGKFNMGSTGSLRFCTRSEIRDGHFKLIMSRPIGTQYWGWTLVRVREPKGQEVLPVAEYFCPGKSIPRFRDKALKGFSHDKYGIIDTGSIVKLYEYDIGRGNSGVDFGLYDALTVSLIDCALPIRLYDFDAVPVQGRGALRAEGIAARTFSGLSVVLGAEMTEEVDENGEFKEKGDPDTEFVYQVTEENNPELGKIKIVATGLRKIKDFLSHQPARIFYTINGQAHAIERASFLNQRCNQPDLVSHLIVNVVCDDLNRTALATIFMPDRERKTQTELSRRLEDIVIHELKTDEKLRQYAAEIRLRRATDKVDNSEETKELLKELVKADPAIRDLFGMGAFLPMGIGGYEDGEGKGQKMGDVKGFKGKKFPTFLKMLNVREERGVFYKDVPINAVRRIECGTDAENEYLTRVDSPGKVWTSLPPEKLPSSIKLNNGIARITVRAPEGAKVGEVHTAEFGFVDHVNIEPLKVTVQVRFVAPEKPQQGGNGTKKKTAEAVQQGAGQPNFQFVGKADWDEYRFDDDSGAYVGVGDNATVYINQDNRYLVNMRVKEKDEAQRVLNENTFKMGLGLIALAVHKKASVAEKEDEEEGTKPAEAPMDPELATRQATAAIAPYIVTIIRRLGGSV